MKYGKIRGASVSECMLKLRRQFGDDVVILKSEQVQEGGLFGSNFLSHKLYEVKYSLPERKSRYSAVTSRAKEEPVSGIKEVPAEPIPPLAEKEPTPAALTEQLSSLDSETKAELLKQLKAEASKPQRNGGDPIARFAEAFTDPAEFMALNRMLADQDPFPETAQNDSERASLSAADQALEDYQPETQEEVEDSSQYSDTAYANASFPKKRRPEPVFSQMQAVDHFHGMDLDDAARRNFERIRCQFVETHMSPSFCDSFLRNLDHHLSREQKRDYHRVMQAARQKLAERIITIPQIAPPEGQCKAVMLMGPSGVGKTTTLAKIAASNYASRDISIYTLDYYRIAATEQLKAYADVMQLDFHAPRNTEELIEQIQRDGAEILLMDASGISFRDTERLDKLREMCEAIRREIRLDRHLCLAANLSAHILDKIMDSYERVGFDKIILTKLDEADFIGSFIEVADKFNKAFSLLCNGWEVPNDIADADSAQMAAMLLDDRAASRV